MSNVFPELLSINVFALLLYTVKLCLKNLTLLPQPRKWPYSTSNHCQCKWFLSRLGHFKHFAAGKQTKSNWKMKKVLPSQRSPSNLLRLASSFNFWCCYASMWPCVSSKPNEVAFVVLRENCCQLALLQCLSDLKDNKCTLRSGWFSLRKRMLFTINIHAHGVDWHKKTNDHNWSALYFREPCPYNVLFLFFTFVWQCFLQQFFSLYKNKT